jgi:NAD(P)-dependent dehydrogenase (short-subunit alcohol dehydrogenase family)
MGMTLDFDGRLAVVAGGSGGIGAAVCRRFARSGLPVVFTYHRNEARALQIKREVEGDGGRCDFVRANLSVAEEVEHLFRWAIERYGSVGHVVCAAGPTLEFNYIGDIAEARWVEVVSADLTGAFHLIQCAVRNFRAGGLGGNLVAITTSAVKRVPIKDALSAAPKAGVEMLIRGVAKECGRFGIRANCVGPGWIDAGMGKHALESVLDTAGREALRTRTIPLGRFGTAEDVADATAFLCSRQASFISGQSLAVDGGAQV